MSRTLVDVDDALLAEAARLLGTRTKKDTVNAALAELVKQRRRAELVDWLAGDPLPDLRDDAVMDRAWR